MRSYLITLAAILGLTGLVTTSIAHPGGGGSVGSSGGGAASIGSSGGGGSGNGGSSRGGSGYGGGSGVGSSNVGSSRGVSSNGGGSSAMGRGHENGGHGNGVGPGGRHPADALGSARDAAPGGNVTHAARSGYSVVGSKSLGLGHGEAALHSGHGARDILVIGPRTGSAAEAVRVADSQTAAYTPPKHPHPSHRYSLREPSDLARETCIPVGPLPWGYCLDLSLAAQFPRGQ
jgi:hypothetical protein